MKYTITIFLWFSYYFVLGEVINDDGNNPNFNHTINEITEKIVNTLLFNFSAVKRGQILNILESISLKQSENLSSRDKERVRLIMKKIKLKVLSETDDKQMAAEENAAKEVEVSDNGDSHELQSELSSKLKSLIKSEFSYLNTSEKNNFTDLAKLKTTDVIDDILVHKNNNMRIFKPEIKNDGKVKSVLKGAVKVHKNVNHIDKYKKSKELKPSPDCHTLAYRTCQDIKSMNRVKCLYEPRYITVDKLCDGKQDCLFKSDEKNCYSQVKEQYLYVQQMGRVMDSISHNKCYKYDMTRATLINQAKKLRNVLKTGFQNDMMRKTKHANNVAAATANKIALVISSLAFTLDGALCSDRLVNIDFRRSYKLFDVDLEKEFKKALVPTKDCKCKNEFCLNCTHYCRRLCRQKVFLTKWNCESVDGASAVSLDFLCDGKIDCIDESDEKGCETGPGYGKFEASEIYNSIVNSLQLKAFKQRQPIRNELHLLSNSIMKLQKLTTNSVAKPKAIKTLRDKCYLMLKTIYSDIVKTLDIGIESEEEYLFLLSINENLGTALKRSHTGNVRLIKDKCHCRNGTCSKPFCTKICAKACIVKPKLTRYHCNGKFNKSVSVDKICDGIEDCSNGNDEFNCRKDEICRPHHVLMLMHMLEMVGENLKGSAVGELLSTWKLKTISTLKVLQNTAKLTPRRLKKFADQILNDLTMTYGSVETYKRSTANYVLGVFIDLSRAILESIKLCGK